MKDASVARDTDDEDPNMDDALQIVTRRDIPQMPEDEVISGDDDYGILELDDDVGL